MTTANLTKVIVPCRLSYAHLWEPDSINGSEPKYSVSCIIDKNDKETIAKIKKAIEVAKDEGKGKWGGKIPANLKTPLRDGDIDRPEDEAYAANCIWMNGKVIVPDHFPKVAQIVRDAGYEVILVDTSEYRKIDGGLSCLSLRFTAQK